MVTQERFVNNAQTTLTSKSLSADATITVINAVDFPTEGNFRVMVDTEIMLVTAVSTNIFTVTRGVDGTAAFDHVAGSQVMAIVTRDSLSRMIAEHTQVLEVPPFRLADSSGNVLTSADFTTHNAGTLTVTDDLSGPITLGQTGVGSTTLAKILRTAPTAPYTIVGAYTLNVMSAGASPGGTYGPFFRRSSADEILLWRHAPCDVLAQRWRVSHYLGDVFQSGITNLSRFEPSPSGVVWFKLVDDNTNLEMWLSNDGINWTLMYQAGRLVTLGSAPDQIGISINNISSKSGFVHLLAWQE